MPVENWSETVVVVRLSDDPRLSDEVLEQTRAWIDDKGMTRVTREG